MPRQADGTPCRTTSRVSFADDVSGSGSVGLKSLGFGGADPSCMSWGLNSMADDVPMRTKSTNSFADDVPKRTQSYADSSFTKQRGHRLSQVLNPLFFGGDTPKAIGVLTPKVQAMGGGEATPATRKNFDLAVVREILASFVEELGKPSRQRKFQILLIHSRQAHQSIVGTHDVSFYGGHLDDRTSGGEADVCGRGVFRQYALQDTLTNEGMGTTSTTDMWKCIKRFQSDADVISMLSMVDELLALPPETTRKGLMDPTHPCSPFAVIRD